MIYTDSKTGEVYKKQLISSIGVYNLEGSIEEFFKKIDDIKSLVNKALTKGVELTAYKRGKCTEEKYKFDKIFVEIDYCEDGTTIEIIGKRSLTEDESEDHNKQLEENKKRRKEQYLQLKKEFENE